MLTYVQIRDAARKAYEAGTLLAQGDHRAVPWDYGYAVTRGDETRRCAIGAALTREQIDAISAWGLHRTPLCTVDPYKRAPIRAILGIPPADLDAAVALQALHDAWMGAEHEGEGSDKERAAFVKALYAD